MKKKLLFAVIINYAIFIMEVIGSIQSWINHVDRFGCGLWMFKNYTQSSNVFAGIVSLIFAIQGTIALKKGSSIGKNIHFFRFISTCCLGVTFLVVVAFLGPTSSEGFFAELVSGALIYMHTLCPICAILSFIFLESEPALEKKHIFYAIIPTLLYAAIIISLIAIRFVDDPKIPYSFLRIYNQPVLTTIFWLLIIPAGNLLLATGITLANKKAA